jgi:protein O-GlcNAc transferase
MAAEKAVWPALLLLAACGGVSPVRDPFNRGVALHSQGRYDEAIAEYRLALRDQPRDHQAAFNLAATLEAKADNIRDGARREARIREARGHAEDATRLLEEAASEESFLRREAEAVYRGILSEEPSFVPAAVNLAILAEAQGDREGALAALAALVHRIPTSVTARISYATLLQRAGRLDEALEQAEAARRRDPTDVDLNMLFARLHEARGERNPARRAYQRVLDREDGHLGALLALGRLELDAGRPEEARAWFLRARYLAPRVYEIHLRLAEIAESDGRLEDAVLGYWAARELESYRPLALAEVDVEARLARLLALLHERAQAAAGLSGGPVP